MRARALSLTRRACCAPGCWSRYAGFYKAVQAGGAAVAWMLGELSPETQLYINWGLFLLACAPAWVMAESMDNTPPPSKTFYTLGTS